MANMMWMQNMDRCITYAKSLKFVIPEVLIPPQCLEKET